MKLPIYILAALLGGGVMASCNSESDPVTMEEFEYNNLMVSSFSLKKNDSIISNLDSVFFSIDLNNALIYNADSLPKGTRIDRLQVSMTLPTVQEANLVYRTSEGKDSTVNYLTNPNDSIDFSNGPVMLKLKSYSGNAERTYQIKVNVHEMMPDSLYWNKSAVCPLPTSLQSVTAQRTIMFDGKVAVFTTDGTDVCMALNANPYDDSAWETSSVTLPVSGDITSISSLGATLYITDGTTLWQSTDKAATWTATSGLMSHIYGACGDMLLGVRKDADGKYWHTSYPVSNETEVPDGCPVSGTSLPIVYTSEWSYTPMMLILGGYTASGELTGTMWGYEGGEWACVSNVGIPAAESPVFFPYFTFSESGAWSVNSYTTLFAISEGKTYISRNRGINWQLGDASLQLPDYMPVLTGAQGIVVPNTMTASVEPASASSWREMPVKALPSWLKVETSGSRVSSPIESWDCPYIYIFGGKTADGAMSNTVWRGVINRLSFKPIV